MSKKGPVKSVVVSESANSRPAELRKAVDAIYVYPHQGRLTLMSRRAFNLLLARAMESGVDQEWYEIPIAELAKDMRFDSKDMKHLEDTLDAMQTTLLKWDAIESLSGRSVRVRDSVQLLGAVQLVGGYDPSGPRSGLARTVRYQFDKRVKQRLLVPEVYARINLQLQSEFSSSHTLALYEQVIRYRSNTSADGWAYTVKLPWRDWRNLLIGGDGTTVYEQYKYFSRDVLNKALRELSQVVSEFDFEMLVYKTGRTIDKLQFRMRPKAQQSLGLTVTKPLIDTGNMHAQLLKLGVKEADISKILDDFDPEIVKEAAKQTEARVRRTDLQPLGNPTAYLLDTVKRIRDQVQAAQVRNQKIPGPSDDAKKDEAPAGGVDVLDAEEAPAKRRRANSLSERRSVKEGWEEIESQFRDLPKKKRDALVQQFVASVSDNQALSRELARGGFDGPLVRASFVPWLKRELDL